MEAQVQKLLEAIISLTTAMQTQQTQQNNTSVNIISNFENFDPKVESFKNYKERLELHFQVKKVFADKVMCAKLLLQYIGPAVYTLAVSCAQKRQKFTV